MFLNPSAFWTSLMPGAYPEWPAQDCSFRQSTLRLSQAALSHSRPASPLTLRPPVAQFPAATLRLLSPSSPLLPVPPRGRTRQMPPHTHQMGGFASLDAEHVHRFAAVTGAALPVNASHVHMYEGMTATEAGHAHWFDGVTTGAIPSLGGHIHTFRVPTTPVERPRHHTHIISGRTTRHRGA